MFEMPWTKAKRLKAEKDAAHAALRRREYETAREAARKLRNLDRYEKHSMTNSHFSSDANLRQQSVISAIRVEAPEPSSRSDSASFGFGGSSFSFSDSGASSSSSSCSSSSYGSDSSSSCDSGSSSSSCD